MHVVACWYRNLRRNLGVLRRLEIYQMASSCRTLLQFQLRGVIWPLIMALDCVSLALSKAHELKEFDKRVFFPMTSSKRLDNLVQHIEVQRLIVH